MQSWLSFGTILGVAGSVFGLYQWLIAQRWRKAEFAAAQLQRLSSDPALLACCRALDWDSRTLQVPERWRIEKDELTFQHDWKELLPGMQPENQKKFFSRTQVIYRDLFDELFTYLEQINHFIGIGLIRTEHVESLSYWLRELANPRFGSPTTFIPFIEHYQYTGVLELMKRFKVNHGDAS